MSTTDYNLRAAKGQAYNLAVHDAISKGKQDSNKYIITQYIKYYELGQLVQDLDLKDLIEELNKN